MELIDRRKLVDDFWKGVEDGSILSYEDTDDLMENAPTVDAVEVVHGEWTIIEDDYVGLIGLECSHCEKTWWFDEESSFRKYHYCPGCGADMRGDGNA